MTIVHPEVSAIISPSVPALTPKRSPLDFKLFGGNAIFPQPIHVGRPNLPHPALALSRFEDILKRAWLSNDGPYLRQFEEMVAGTLGVRHCVATCNATTALQLLIAALELSGEVIVPGFTFAATAHALAWQGVRPVFADIDPITWNLDPNHVETLITTRTSAILGVHLFGTPCPVEALQALAARHDVKLIFDASHAFAASHRGQWVGNFGEAEVFSFHATKFISAGEGGAITTNCDLLSKRLRALRSFGIDHRGEAQWIGINGKMSEFSAALGLTNLELLSSLVARNRLNYENYRIAFADIPGVRIHHVPGNDERNYQYVVAEIEPEAFGLARDEVAAILRQENLLVRRYFVPGCHQLRPYLGTSQHDDVKLPRTDQALERVLVFPNGLHISTEIIEQCAACLRFIAAEAPSVRALCRAHYDEVQAALDPPREAGRRMAA